MGSTQACAAIMRELFTTTVLSLPTAQYNELMTLKRIYMHLYYSNGRDNVIAL